MMYFYEFIFGTVSLAAFIGIYIYQKSSDKFESVAHEIRSIKRLSEYEKRMETAFPDLVNQQKIEYCYERTFASYEDYKIFDYGISPISIHCCLIRSFKKVYQSISDNLGKDWLRSCYNWSDVYIDW